MPPELLVLAVLLDSAERFVPAASAHEIARKLQGAKGSTISVL